MAAHSIRERHDGLAQGGSLAEGHGPVVVIDYLGRTPVRRGWVSSTEDLPICNHELVTPPVLLLDVDGVLAIRGTTTIDDTETHIVDSAAGDSHTIVLRQQHGSWIRTLAEHFQVVWTTGWEHDAPRLLGPLLDLPEFMVLEFSQRPSFQRPLRKTPDVARLVGDRPAAWVDDDLDDEATEWANTRPAPTLLIQPDPMTGLMRRHVAQLLDFAASLPDQS